MDKAKGLLLAIFMATWMIHGDEAKELERLLIRAYISELFITILIIILLSFHSHVRFAFSATSNSHLDSKEMGTEPFSLACNGMLRMRNL